MLKFRTIVPIQNNLFSGAVALLEDGTAVKVRVGSRRVPGQALEEDVLYVSALSVDDGRPATGDDPTSGP